MAASNQCGGASWYGPGFNGKKTASGERFNQNAMTAAHKSLPMGTKVRVVDQRSGKSVTVTINDRGPFVRGRIIDLSKAAATELGFRARGHTKVCLAQI
jgi:rare lipoprotein A